jgi:hypothetical protein
MRSFGLFPMRVAVKLMRVAVKLVAGLLWRGVRAITPRDAGAWPSLFVESEATEPPRGRLSTLFSPPHA